MSQPSFINRLFQWLKSLFIKAQPPQPTQETIGLPIENPTIEHDREPPEQLVRPETRFVNVVEFILASTGRFEGKGFQQATGDFDGMGVSAGILQWNYGTGSLQSSILRPFIANHGSIDARQIFPIGIDATANMTTAQAVQFARTHMIDAFKSANPLKPEWRAAWQKFLGLPEVMQIQRNLGAAKARKAVTLATEWGYGESPRAIHFFFDILVQNGSMKGVTKPTASRQVALQYAQASQNARNRSLWTMRIERADEEMLTLFQAGYLRSLRSNPRWQQDVFSRKGTIALGEGWVHGELFKFNTHYDILSRGNILG